MTTIIPTHSHVLPALIRRFHEAKEAGLEEVVCWGDGSPLREFLYVDDLANLCVFLMNNYSGNETVNAGSGKGAVNKKNCRSWLQRPWAIPAALSGTPQNPMVLRVSCLMCVSRRSWLDLFN